MGLWQEVSPAQQRPYLKIPGQDLTISINRWTPRAWWRGRGGGRKLYLTVITIWHLPELHILDESSLLSRSAACENEAAVNRILLAPMVAVPCRGPKNTSPVPHLHAICKEKASDVRKLLVGWRRRGGLCGHLSPSCVPSR